MPMPRINDIIIQQRHSDSQYQRGQEDISKFFVFYHGEKLGDVTLNLPGNHNVNNALASIAVGLELDVSFPVI